MGSEAINAAAITAAGQIASTGISALAQGSINKKTRKYNLQQYQKERADALNDWNRNNSYNSPASQMQRYKEAGLNPNLIYGQQNTADPVRSTNTAPWNPRAPNIDLNAGPTISAFYDTRMKQAETDNMIKQGDVLTQEKLLKAAQTAATVQGTSTNEFQLGQAQKLSSISLETAAEELRGKLISNNNQIQQNERNEAITSSNIKEAAERILEIRARVLKTQTDNKNAQLEYQRIQKTIDNLDKDSALKQMDMELRKRGITPSDPMYMRMLGQWLKDHNIPTLEEIKSRSKQLNKTSDSLYEDNQRKKGWSNPNR